MNEMPLTYLRQARSFLLAGDAARAVDLLERASVLVRGDMRLLYEITEELASAYDSVGRSTDAQRLRARLDTMAMPPSGPSPAAGLLTPPPNLPTSSLANWRMLAIAGLLVALGLGLWAAIAWQRNAPAGSSSGQTAQAVAPSPANAEPADAGIQSVPVPAPAAVIAPPPPPPAADAASGLPFLQENVAMLVVAASYADQKESWLVPVMHGTAFAVTSDGLMLTNRHVVDPPHQQQFPSSLHELGRPTVTMRGLSLLVCFSPQDRVEARVVYKSDAHDLAILKVNRRFDRPLVISYDPPVQGEEALACGYPGIVKEMLDNDHLTEAQINDHIARFLANGNMNLLDLFAADSFQSTLTRGIVSQGERHISGSTYVQTDASVCEGNSGGPLLNSRSQVIGIVTLGVSAGSGNYNFALRMDQLKPELEQNGVR